MTPARIAELLAPFLPDPDQLAAGDLEHISTYIDILTRWNARVNLTAVRDPEQIVTRHFGESFFAARHLFSGEERHQNAAQRESRGSTRIDNTTAHAQKKVTVADIGSGAGFPGIPIKLWAPHITLTLIESNYKKATFLKEVARALTLTNINIQAARAETLKTRFDVVTLRAVERFETIFPTAASLAAPGGRLALLIGSSQLSIATSRLQALELGEPIPIPQSSARILVVAQHRE